MFDFIKEELKGSTATLAITGLPVTITGEIVSVANNIVGIRLANGNKVYINVALIAFIF